MKPQAKILTMGIILTLQCAIPPKKGDSRSERNQAQTQHEETFFEDQKNSEVTNGMESGFASWYGKELQGKPTASGEMFDMNQYTGAHRTFPMGSVVLVKNMENGKKQLVKINDRGPYVEGRIIDVSYVTAKDLDFAAKGVARVEIELIQPGKDDFLSKAGEMEITDDKVADKDLKIDEDEFDLEEDAPETNGLGFTFADGRSPAGYTIQVGAFKNRVNAERYRDEFEDRYNHRGFIASEGKWHYVWLGDLKTSKEAKVFLKKLKKDGYQVFYRGKITKSAL